VELIDDGILVPKLIVDRLDGWHLPCIRRKTAAVVERISSIETEGNAGLGAFAGLGFSVHGDAIAMEMTPPFSFAEKETFRTYVRSRSPGNGSPGTRSRLER
jgi:hypothetical protein